MGVFICGLKVYNAENLYVLLDKYVGGKSCCSQIPFIP